MNKSDRSKGRGNKVSFSPVKEFALQHNIPVLQPEKVRQPLFIQELSALKPDLIVVVAYGQILPREILVLPPLGCINVHASLLPAYRGAAPIHWAIINGEKITGVTTMYMDIGMDTGDMLLQHSIQIEENQTSGQLHDELKEIGARLLLESVILLEQDLAPRIPQDNMLATYAPMLNRSHEKIDWSLSAEQIHNLIRGLNPWPGAYCLYNEKILKIWSSKIVDRNMRSGQPGRIYDINKYSLVVETGQGLLGLIELQPECKRRMSVAECACGYCFAVGDIMG